MKRWAAPFWSSYVRYAVGIKGVQSNLDAKRRWICVIFRTFTTKLGRYSEDNYLPAYLATLPSLPYFSTFEQAASYLKVP